MRVGETMLRIRSAIAIAIAAGTIAACNNPFERGTYSLYRTSIVHAGKVHVATFNTEEGEAYNRENCETAARLFNQQPGVQTRFFCEPGRAR